MAIPLGVDRKLAYQSAPALKTVVGRAGVIKSFLTSEVAVPEIASLYTTDASPTMETSSISSVYSTSVE